MSLEFGGEPSRKPPIVQWFVIRRLPAGDAPEHIKQQWIDVPLPLRKLRNMDAPQPGYASEFSGDRRQVFIADTTVVRGPDAIKALRLFKRPEAAAWWEATMHTAFCAALIFDATEGEYWSLARLEAALPGINEFDERA